MLSLRKASIITKFKTIQYCKVIIRSHLSNPGAVSKIRYEAFVHPYPRTPPVTNTAIRCLQSKVNVKASIPTNERMYTINVVCLKCTNTESKILSNIVSTRIISFVLITALSTICS